MHKLFDIVLYIIGAALMLVAAISDQSGYAIASAIVLHAAAVRFEIKTETTTIYRKNDE